MCVLAQVKINLLLLECMSAADHWQDARQHAEAFHRSLPLAKHKGPTAAAALESLAAWRATCVVKAGSGHAMEDMPRLLSELSTAQAKVCALLFSRCCMACALTRSMRFVGFVSPAHLQHWPECGCWMRLFDCPPLSQLHT
jgi:hypothetical protein